jgi:hypothetical protein
MEQESAVNAGGSAESERGATIDATVERRLALLLDSYGKAFAGDSAALARAAIEQAVARDLKLRTVPLANADEAAGSFAPYRASGPGGSQ